MIDYTNSKISKLEFHSMLQKILKDIKIKLRNIREQNPIHKDDFDFILWILDSVIKNNKKKIDDLEEEENIQGELEDL